MAVIQSTDPKQTTAVVDIGTGPMAVYVGLPVTDVKQRLKDGDWVYGDSPQGEMHFAQAVVKCLFRGRREISTIAANRD